MWKGVTWFSGRVSKGLRDFNHVVTHTQEASSFRLGEPFPRKKRHPVQIQHLYTLLVDALLNAAEHYSRFCTQGMQQSRVAGIHIALKNDRETPMAVYRLMI
jgi:hypothetical protein